MRQLKDLISEQLQLQEGNLQILMDLAYDSNAAMNKDMRKYGLSAKFYKRHGGAEEYTVSGPKDKLKKYVLDWSDGSYDNDELKDMYPQLFEQIDSLFESQYEFDTLEEAINSFAELPASWKKEVQMSDTDVKYYEYGENSKIISKASKEKFKNIGTAARFIRNSINFDEVKFLWVELNDEPVFGISKNLFGNGGKKLSLLTIDGNYHTVLQKVSHTSGFRGTGKNSHWVPPQHKHMNVLSASDIEDKCRWYLYDLIKGLIGNENATTEDCDEFFKTYKLSINVKGLGIDENRLAKRNSRKESKEFIDANTQLKINTSIKYIKSKMSINIDSIRSDMLAELDKFERGESYSFDSLIKRMDSVRSVVKQIEEIRKNKKYEPFRYSSRWGLEKNYDLKSALAYVKELEDLAK